MNTTFISEIDFTRLRSLHVLEEALEQAEVLELQDVPKNLITMNTRFSYLNLENGKTSELTIVYPQHTDLSKRLISVTAPLGAAFLGLKEGDEIDCELPDEKVVKLRVLKILYQPERLGDFHL